MTLRYFFSAILIAAMLIAACPAAAIAQPTSQPKLVRVAITGGVNDNGLWDALTAQFEKKSGIHVETVSTGAKDSLAARFKQGGLDLIAMYSSDALMDLAADGYAIEVSPFAMGDLILVGPANDPAGVRNAKSFIDALQQIVEKKSPLVVHGSLGADVVFRNAAQAATHSLDAPQITILANDHQRQVLQVAIDKKAYTLIARVPFRSGKLDHGGLDVILEGDRSLRRPYLLAFANPSKISGAKIGEAEQFARFLRSADVQRTIADHNKSKFGDFPEYFPIDAVDRSTPPAGTLAEIRRVGGASISITSELMAKLPRIEQHVKNEAGLELAYSGVLLRDLLKLAGAPIGESQFRGPDARRTVIVGADDGYEAAFSLTEFATDFGDATILLADQKAGAPLPANEGPLRIIVSKDHRSARWIRHVAWIEIR